MKAYVVWRKQLASIVSRLQASISICPHQNLHIRAIRRNGIERVSAWTNIAQHSYSGPVRRSCCVIALPHLFMARAVRICNEYFATR